MNVLIAPDSFKESAAADQVASAIADGLKRIWPHARFTLAPMADGGEGTVDAAIQARNGHYVSCAVHDAMRRPIDAQYGILDDHKIAVIEMAAASGLPQISPAHRDPAVATTYGTGELIRDALRRGIPHIVVGMGGSATNDGGAGMATALGYGLLDDRGAPLPPGGLALARLHTIDPSSADPRVRRTRIEGIYDVDVPLYGPSGSSLMFAPQKGADPATARQLDDALHHFAQVIQRQLGLDVTRLPGAGAAGGLGAGLAAFAGAQLTPGVEWVSRTIDLESKIQHTDLVITGEGKLDAQTRHGKVPAGVAALARKHGIPVVAFAGYADPLATAELRGMFARVVPLCTDPTDIPAAMRETSQRLMDAAEAFAHDWERMIKSQGE